MKLICRRGEPYEYQDPATKKHYFSVSQVLTVLDPDAFKGIDPFILAAAQDRGKDLHVLLALRLLSVLNLNAPPKRPDGVIGKYYDGIEKFVRERKPVPIKVEHSSINDKDGYAGTADTQSMIDEDPTEWIIDLKTGPERAVHAVQLIGGYKRLKGFEKAKRYGSLYIRKNGTYSLVEHTHDHVALSGFIGGLTTLKWRRIGGVK